MKKRLLLIATLFLGITAFAQKGEITLKMGDKAPDLKVKWIKGTPVNQFEDNMLYLVEFWSTWCGPCKAAMPHLSELARKYQGKVTFIGVNVWERDTKDQPYDSITPDVEEFVKTMGDKMDYLVAIDNNDLFMANNWMRAAGQNGIPASFLIQKGQIVWIGHPNGVESIITQVLDGSYNLDETSKKIEAETKRFNDMMSKFREVTATINKAMEAKDYDRALAIIEEGFKSVDKSFHGSLKGAQLNVYLEKGTKEAKEFINSWVAAEPRAKMMVAYQLARKEGLDPYFYDFAISALKEQVKSGDEYTPITLLQIAELYNLKGDKKHAVSTVKEAIKAAQKIIKEGSSANITEGNVKAMQERLEVFKGKK